MKVDRDAVIGALTPDAVLQHYQIQGRWHGRWFRSRRCPKQDHSTDAMGMSVDSKFACHACDLGGDLLTFIALAEKLDIRSDFAAVLERAAEIAGIVADDDFGGSKPARPTRPPPPALPPLHERIATAKKRAAWVWSRLHDMERVRWEYLASRKIDPDVIVRRETLKATPMRVTADEIYRRGGHDGAVAKLGRMFAKLGICIPVRHVADGTLVDIRSRRLDPQTYVDDNGAEATEPKVIGMLGGIVRDGDELIGCYGHPHELEAEHVVVVEGWADYLTAILKWPYAAILGAVDAGSYPLVAGFAARAIAERGTGKVTLVAQWDGLEGAADRAVNVASKRAISLVGPGAVEWHETGPAHKDLNAEWCAAG